MNFENLKSDWDNVPENEVNIPENLNVLEKSKLPIELLKTSLRKEFFTHLFALVFLGILPVITSFQIIQLKLYYLGYFILVVISSLFLMKFYNFYKYLVNLNLKTKETLYELYYELRLNLEAYKTWTYLMAPFLIILLFHIFFNEKLADKLNLSPILTDNLLFLFSIILISCTYVYYSTEWWLTKTYKKHLIYIKNLINNLIEENYNNESIEKNQGFIHALLTNNGNKLKSLMMLIIRVAILLGGYYLFKFIFQ